MKPSSDQYLHDGVPVTLVSPDSVDNYERNRPSKAWTLVVFENGDKRWVVKDLLRERNNG